MVKKIRSRGTTIATPHQNTKATDHAKTEFGKRILVLCPGQSLDEKTLDHFCFIVGKVNGKWLSEWDQPEALPIARRLASSARFLEDLAQGLAGVQTGMRQPEDIEFALLIREVLKYWPHAIKKSTFQQQYSQMGEGAGLQSEKQQDEDFENIKLALRASGALSIDQDLSRADEKLASFQQQCSEMAQVFWVAFVMLREGRGKGGRKELDWYDDFTELLLEIAQLANIEPNLHKDRSTGERGGWLFQAAQALEYFLYPPMRSPSPEACGKRLERSLKRLKQRHRQIDTKRKSFMSM